MEKNILDPPNEIDLFSLHLSFRPLMDQSIKEFVATWNAHGISTRHLGLKNRSPNRLFRDGLIDLTERSIDENKDFTDPASTATSLVYPRDISKGLWYISVVYPWDIPEMFLIPTMRCTKGDIWAMLQKSYRIYVP